MRVLVVSHTYIHRFNRQKLELIAAAGVEIGLLAPSNWKNIGGLFAGQPAPIEPAEPPDRVRLFGAKTWRGGHVASYAFHPGELGKVLREFSPDLIHVEQEIYSYAAAQVALQMGRQPKLVLFSWENLDRPFHVTQRLARRITCRRADAVISGNQAGADLMRQWGFRKRIEVFPQVGVDPARYPERPPAPAGAPLRIGFVGRHEREKGGDLLLRAAAKLQERGLVFDLAFCGSGSDEAEWKTLAARLGLQDRVTWHGSVPHGEVPAIMARMDVLVLPSRASATWIEQFGLVLPQAMLMGIPVIGSTCGAIPEVIAFPDAIFPENDFSRLAEILEPLLRSPEQRRTARERGRQRALEHYTAARIAQKTHTLWRELLFPTPP